MVAWGSQPNGQPWQIGITNPFKPDTIFTILPLRQNAMVTSGSYQKFVILNGKRYAHIINPKNGYPATGLISVSITGPSAEKANGFSTSMMVMGKEKALKFIKRFPAYRYIIITDNRRVISSKPLGVKSTRI